MADQNENLVFAAEITAAWLSNPNTRASTDEVPAFFTRMYEAVRGLEQPQAEQSEQQAAEASAPVVSVRKSLANPDHIISMIDGKPYKTLRRHLAMHGLTPDQYRERYRLKSDYPMTAANYSEARRALAKQIGLGRKLAQSPAGEGAGTAVPDTSKRSRRKPVEA